MNIYIFGLFLVIIVTVLKLSVNLFVYKKNKIVIKEYFNESIYIYSSVLILDYIINTYFDVKIINKKEESPEVYTDTPTF